MPYAPFILAAYGAAALIVALIVGWIAFDYLALKRALAQFEKHGVVRDRGEQAGTPP